MLPSLFQILTATLLFLNATTSAADVISSKRSELIRKAQAEPIKSQDYTRAQFIYAVNVATNLDLLNIYELIFDTSSEENGINELHLLYGFDPSSRIYVRTLAEIEIGKRSYETLFEVAFLESNKTEITAAEMAFARFFLENSHLLGLKTSQNYIYSFKQVIGALMSYDFSELHIQKLLSIFGSLNLENDILEYEVLQKLLILGPGNVSEALLNGLELLIKNGSNRNGLSEDILIGSLLSLQFQESYFDETNEQELIAVLKDFLDDGEVRKNGIRYPQQYANLKTLIPPPKKKSE